MCISLLDKAIPSCIYFQNLAHVNTKKQDIQRNITFMMSGSFQGPLLDRRHPPSKAHVQEPPRKSGN